MTKKTYSSVTATAAKNGFASVMESAAREGGVVITKHDKPKAVVLSYDEYLALGGAPPPSLDALTAEFDAMLDAMQRPGQRAAMQAAFDSSPAELAKAFRAGATKTRRG